VEVRAEAGLRRGFGLAGGVEVVDCCLGGRGGFRLMLHTWGEGGRVWYLGIDGLAGSGRVRRHCCCCCCWGDAAVGMESSLCQSATLCCCFSRGRC
jgi:hypothetical protein